jgi:hypothetical protein
MAQIVGELYVSLNTTTSLSRLIRINRARSARPVVRQNVAGNRADDAQSGRLRGNVHAPARPSMGFPVDPGWDLRRDGAWYDLVGGEADQVAPIAHRFAMLWQAASRLHVESGSTGFVRIGWRISAAACPGRCAAACSPGSAAVARRGCCVYTARLAGETIVP